MANQLLSIQDAANLSNKSVQTIRRLVKNGKVKYRRKRTPQGFHYMVDKASLLEECDLINQINSEQPVQQVEEPISQQPEQVVQEPRKQQPIQEQPVYKVDNEPRIYILDSQQETSSDTVEQPEKPQQQAPQEVLTNQNIIIEKLLDQQREDKEKLYQILEAYQKRVFILEDQVKLLQAPKKKWWKWS